jgi:3'-phosphoadenosine 5'-phosphosulfate sulfotransferase (PAPS reductase)/FAD synthetase
MPPVPPQADPQDVLRRLRYETDEINVGFSCGKDSVCMMDLCLKWFKRVGAFYMYITPGLSFHEQYMRYWEERAGAKLALGRIIRLPHWALSRRLAAAALRDDDLPSNFRIPDLRIRDVEVAVYKQTGIKWFAHGLKKCDSLQRRAMLNQSNGIMLVSCRGYPLSEWSNADVVTYLKLHDIPLSPEYAHIGHSYGGGLEGGDLVFLRDHYPADYQKVLARFPFAEAELLRHELGLTGRPRAKNQVKR